MPKVIGVDLGTTNSCVAVMESGVPVIIPNAEGTFLTPSVVAINRNGERLVGEAARRQATINPENTIFSIKRFMGRKYEDPIVDRDRRLLPYKVVRASNGDAWVEVQGKQYSPPEISAMILQKLKNDAETYLGERVTQAVITVPAHFNNIQRQATKDAAKIAGLEILRIINEPTAASLAYGLDRKKDECIAVYSFGGGTFDISILQLGDGVFEVRSTLGDSHLGGDDFDQRIINWLADEFRKEQGIDPRQDRMALQRLKDGAEKAKKELSSMMQTEINLPFITADASGPKHLTMTLPRSQLEQLVENLVEKSRNPVMKALADADVRPDGINAVILTGGQTRMPAVQRLVRQIFNREPKRSINPDEAVAIGAAIQAGVLTGDVKDVLLLDVTPLSLGIETLGGVFTRLIEHNTTIPTQKSQTFSTRAYNNETFLMDPYVTASVKINVLQGEKNLVKDNQALGSLVLDNISFPYSGVPHIEVTFDIDVNGTMNVLARDNNPARGSVQGQKITLAVPKMKGRLSASLGIETFDGIFISLIERNTALPIQKSQIFALCLPSGSNQESLVLPTLPTLSQTSVEISILQGLERFTKDNHSLGSFILDNILPASPGLPQIEVTFDIDKNGNVKVSASGKNTGLTKSMTLVAETDQENHKLRDALGIQTLGGVFTPLTEHDITIPAQKTYVFSTRSANQPTFLPSPSVEINVLQGEREFAKDNRSLGSFILDGILLGPYGVPQLEITFDIDANDILDVEARDKGSGRRQKMTMVASSGLSKEQIDRMVREAERYAGEEKHRRIEIEERYLADSVAHQTEQSITQLGYKLITEQKNNLESRVSDVYTALASNDVARIVSAREVLEITIHHINEAIYRQESSGTVSSSSSEQSDHDSSVDDTIKNELLTALGVPEDKESRKPTSKLGDPEVALIQRMTPQIEYAFGRKDWFDVLRKVDYLIKRAPDAIPATIYRMQGLAFLERGEKQHALEALDIALALVNDDILRLTLLRDYTTILTSLEQWDMVVSFANEALQLVPNEPRWLAIQQEALAQLKLT